MFHKLTRAAMLVLCLAMVVGAAGLVEMQRHQVARLEKLAGADEGALAKQNKTMLTSYQNATFNIKYAAPSGWSFPTPTVMTTGVMLTVDSPSHLATILVASYKRTTENEAYVSAKSWCFSTGVLAWESDVENGHTMAPLIYAIIRRDGSQGAGNIQRAGQWANGV